MLTLLKKELKELANPKKAKVLAGFFKTGKGQYGEGDVFLGITVPDSRKIAKKYLDLSLKDIKKLLSSKIHEARLVALLILVEKYKKSDKKEEIINLYIKNSENINNWDLVDLSSHQILGNYFIDKGKKVLYDLAKSNNLWKKRISIVSTYAFIKNNKFKDTFNISKILLNDNHDLIHKAVGWMLREVGKRNQHEEEKFLKKNYKVMPRTMLRYAIEHFSVEKKQFYMNK